jgi:hypothetical protein
MNYQPLDISRNEIRLVTVLSSAPVAFQDGLVHCQIHHVSLDAISDDYKAYNNSINGLGRIGRRDRLRGWIRASVVLSSTKVKTALGAHAFRWSWGDYAALSYTWGDPSITRNIELNGHVVPVTENLEAALRVLQDPSHGNGLSYFWIDALCINQSDLAERNVQVKRMKDIYEKAACVIKWLGAETNQSKHAMAIIQFLSARGLASDEVYDSTLEALRAYPQAIPDYCWRALGEFLNLSYWRRVWILQEICMADTCGMLLWGAASCWWSEWCEGAFVIIWKLQDTFAKQISKEFGERLQGDAVELIGHMKLMRMLYEVGEEDVDRMPLDKLLHLGRRAQAFDARDRIYGLLGLIDPSITAIIVPDYSKPVPEVYLDFTRAVISATGSLDLICDAMSTGFPDVSWIPDWSAPEQVSALSIKHPFRASRDMKHVFVDHSDRSSLECRGFQFDIISNMACGCMDPRSTSHRSAPNTVGSCPYEINTGVEKAFWNTIICGQQQNIISDGSLNILRELPWFGGTALASGESANLYCRVFDLFQQCNQEFHIFGRPLKEFFKENGLVSPLRCVPSEIAAGEQKVILLLQNLVGKLTTRKLITTSKGYLGLAPKNAQLGDSICILIGSSAPLVLRPQGNNNRLIGDVYIDGIMEGESMRQVETGSLELKKIILC